MDFVVEELGVPRKYLKTTYYEDRVHSFVHKSWLRSLLKYGQLSKFIENDQLEEWPQKDQDLDSSWVKIYITIFKKSDEKVIPLPRVRSLFNKNYSDLSFSQLLHYVMQSNHKNLWKEAYKKHSSAYMEKSTESHINLMDYNTVLREIIIRSYGCQIINMIDSNLSTAYSKYFEPHKNILPASCAIETQFCIFLIHNPFIDHTLQDCVMFSPAILENSFTKPLFIIYQLLQIFLTLHDRSLTIGDITLNDIYLTDNLWIQIIPKLRSNLHVQEITLETKQNVQNDLECRTTGHLNDYSQRCIHCGKKSYDKIVVLDTENLGKLCELWVEGQISNFTYLTALNNLSGRKYGEPNNHHVFPWVTDFNSRCGNNWRDLTKSKFRLNKGDRQLDLTYENSQSQVAHHVSDVLSSITYYVYMARRTPKSVLCKNVRTIWVPAEYPSSIQRLQEWTPDECIPEFFSDPNVFKSIHEDLSDLEVPPWSSSPEEFIEKHREALESSYVSERLHHWIDLTFGYKLSGSAAVKSKNVCLQLVDGHKSLTNCGVVQLFTHPHPARVFVSHFNGKTPPKIHIRQRCRDPSNSSLNTETQRQSEEEDISSGIEDDGASTSQTSGRSPLVLSRLLSRSKSSLNSDDSKESNISKNISKSSHKISPSLGPKYPTFTSHIQKPSPSNSGNTSQSNLSAITVQKSNVQSGIIYLPKEYNPVSSLNTVESFHGFLARTFHSESKSEPREKHSINNKYLKIDRCESETSRITLCSMQDNVFEDNENSFTNRYFTEDFEAKLNKSTGTSSCEFKNKDNVNLKSMRRKKRLGVQSSCNYKQIVASCRVKELQILGCLIVEIFMSKKLRPQRSSHLDFNERLNLCINVLKYHTDVLPRCVKYAVYLLLQIDTNESTVRYPAVTDLGLPPPSAHQLLQPLLNCIFPFPAKFCQIYSFISNLQEYNNLTSELNILYYFDCNGEMCSKYENIERTKILFAQNIGECKVNYCAKELENIFDIRLDSIEIVNILLPYIKGIIEDPCTSVLAAWYLFDPISRVLGPSRTADHLLQSLLKLYENEQKDYNFSFNSKIAKLYHHSFLLRLIVRLGLKTFLDNFITPLVEAVGGYKDIERSDLILHNHVQKLSKKTSNLKNIDDTSELENLSPFDEESSVDSDKNAVSPSDIINVENEPEVFEFDNEDKPVELSPEHGIIETLEYNIANVDLKFNHSTAEEALEENLIDYDKDISNENYPENMLECPKSPTIPIPSTSYQSELITIGCDVGSKNRYQEYFDKSNDEDRKNIDFENFNSSSLQERKLKRNNKISDMSADSLVWLSHRLGPVLTARYLSRNLLRMLTLCYVGKENLEMLPKNETISNESVDSVSIGKWKITGDKNASKVLHCLVSIAALYGEQLILLQYLPHISELIALCKRKLTSNLEGGIISCFALLKHIIPYLVDATLMDQLQDVILRNILHPAARLLSSTKYLFPSGATARNVLARKYLDALYVLALRIGSDLTRTHLAVPALQRFFFAFNKVHGDPDVYSSDAYKPSPLIDSPIKSVGEHYVEVRRDGTIAEWTVRGRPFQISQLKDPDSADSFSPPPSFKNVPNVTDSTSYKAMEELKQVFTLELAHIAFIPFLNYIGDKSMELSLKNYSLIRDLCYEYQQEMNFTNKINTETILLSEHAPEVVCVGSTGSFGSNVALIGNRIDVQIEHVDARQSSILNLISNRMENTNRHLRGNWLAYWEHEIGRADKDTMFNFKQIKLQTFNGHTNSIKAIQVLDNENSFMTGSKDKTIKLWSLRSQGDGTAVSQCQSTYTGHKKSVLSLTFLESLRYTASCDSVVHIWDPFMGSVISQLEGPRVVPVSMLRAMSAPSAVLLAATDTTVKLIDTKICSYIHEFKVALNPVGLIRCLCVSPSGNWLAIGQSSGHIVIVDYRTGLIISAWKAHDGEILQLMSVGENALISSSLDQAISVWNVGDGKLKFNMKGATEPVHCLNMYNSELISGTTANRIGVHTSVDADADFSSTRLRSDTFRGVLTSMAILPLNRLLLLGADSGNISLLC